jgi:hypothetical protein
LQPVVRLVVLPIAIGIVIGLLALIWNRLFGIRVTAREIGLVGGSVIALIIATGVKNDLQTASFLAGSIIGGYFLIKLVAKVMP